MTIECQLCARRYGKADPSSVVLLEASCGDGATAQLHTVDTLIHCFPCLFAALLRLFACCSLCNLCVRFAALCSHLLLRCSNDHCYSLDFYLCCTIVDVLMLCFRPCSYRPVGEGQRVSKSAEEQRVTKSAENNRVTKGAEEQRLTKSAEEQRVTKSAENNRVTKSAEEQRLTKSAEEQR